MHIGNSIQWGFKPLLNIVKASGGCHRFSEETIGRRFSSPPSRMKTDSNLMRVYPFIILIIMNVTTIQPG
ncbi:hypothetical protein D5F11_001215 [Siminovitchia terrae]|uniref:Uncharacterized protein n=1 Tax=Siminovitchia terrae TaxID=1914933 RepID=A0A429XF25_SIMTE|nr:hypothetical protein [Siminovitchia terrae]RST61533.1 hypothetical protein D5F11_001215 [Siminovitchia terrae]